MSKLYEYLVSFEEEEGVVIDATDASHALSEIMDEYGSELTVVSIVRGKERPYKA